MPLSELDIRNAAPAGKPVRLFDGGGLYLEVSPAGGKWWRWKYRHGGKEKRLALGVYPDVSLTDARARRDEARELLAAGIDPSEQRRAARLATLAPTKAPFTLDSDGALVIHLAHRRVILSPQETESLRRFLIATKAVGVQQCD